MLPFDRTVNPKIVLFNGKKKSNLFLDVVWLSLSIDL